MYAVKSSATGGRFALKLLHAHIGEDPENVERFAREARAAGGLRSVHTARVFDADQTASGERFIVMELLEGHDVATELRMRGRLPPAEFVAILLEASVALAAILITLGLIGGWQLWHGTEVCQRVDKNWKLARALREVERGVRDSIAALLIFTGP